MSLRQKYVKVLSGILPAGAVGMSLLLGATAPTAASEHPTTAQPFSDRDPVAERLAAIREAVSAVADTGGKDAEPGDGNWEQIGHRPNPPGPRSRAMSHRRRRHRGHVRHRRGRRCRHAGSRLP